MRIMNQTCECGNPATVRRFGRLICSRCASAGDRGCVGGPNKRWVKKTALTHFQRTHKLLYSPNEQIWFWQMQGPTDWRMSQPFLSEAAARLAYAERRLKFS
jgi:hypothetical protein